MSKVTINTNASGKRKSAEILECILQCGKGCSKTDSIDNIHGSTWENIKNKTLLWKGLDKIGSVYDTTNWAAGPKGLFLHNACRLQLSSGNKLEKAKKRWKKAEEE